MERNALLIERIRFFPQKQILHFVGAILLLLFLLLIVYWPSFFNDFQRAWDDQWMLLGHPMVLDQSPENIWLLFYYGFPILSGEELSLVYYSYVLVAGFFIMYIVVLYRQQKLIPFFGLLFFLINILLVLHILPMPRTMINADRYMYLSTIGLAVWVWWSAYKLIQWIGKFQKWKRRSIVMLWLLNNGLYRNYVF